MLMVRCALVFLWFSTLLCGVCGATGFIEAIPPVDDYRQEIGVYHQELDLEAQDAGFPDLELTQNRVYLQMEVPADEALVLYVRLGAAGIELEGAEAAGIPSDTFDDRYRPWGGVGLKGVLGTNPYVNLGYFVEGSYYARFDDQVAGTSIELEKFWDATAGVALQLQYQGIGLYAGPVAYVSRAELTIGSGSAAIASDYRGDANGVRAGMKIPLGTMMYLTLDGVFGDRTAWGGTLNFAGF